MAAVAEELKMIFKFLLITLLLFGSVVLTACSSGPGEYDDFASCLFEEQVTMYGTEWCSHCQNQKKTFGKSFKYVDFVDCAIVAMAGSFSSGYPARKRIITQSRQNRIYGYIFPIKSLSQLSRNLVNKGVNYNVEGHGVSHKFQNIHIIMGRTVNREETTLQLIEILCNNT